MGVNTLLLSAAFTAPPDIVALAATLTGDGIVNIPGASGTRCLRGGDGERGGKRLITVSADTGGTLLPVNLLVCQTKSRHR